MQNLQTPSQNGIHPAPPSPGGAVRAVPGPGFPPPLAERSLDSLLYRLSVADLIGLNVARWGWGLSLFAAFVLWLLGGRAGGWLALLIVAAIGFLVVANAVYRARGYIRFQPDTTPRSAPGPAPGAAPLSPGDKVPGWVTGVLTVNGRTRRFTCLPAFYRTFATREHMVVGLCGELWAQGPVNWTDADLGLWYLFVEPGSVRSIASGALTHAQSVLPAVRIAYSAGPQTEQARQATETFWFALQDAADLDRILADLALDVPPLSPPEERFA